MTISTIPPYDPLYPENRIIDNRIVDETRLFDDNAAAYLFFDYLFWPHLKPVIPLKLPAGQYNDQPIRLSPGCYKEVLRL